MPLSSYDAVIFTLPDVGGATNLPFAAITPPVEDQVGDTCSLEPSLYVATHV